MSSQHAAPILKRLLKVTLVSRNAFAKAAETVPSADLAEVLVERALDLARIADGLRDQLARNGGIAARQSVEHAQVFVITVLEARRAYRQAMTDAMRKLMGSTPGSGLELPCELTVARPVDNQRRRRPGARRTVPAGLSHRHLVRPAVTDRPLLRLVPLED